MKILAVAEFDCAGVLTGHRASLRALGVDYRLVVRDTYPEIPVEPDWVIPAVRRTREDDDAFSALYDFASGADVIQFHPSIGQPFSYTSTSPHYEDGAADGAWPGIRWDRIPHPGRHRRVSLFHGSRNAAANAEAYAAHWRGRGHEVWATTLDYVARMGASYAPPVVSVGDLRAAPRRDDDPLVVVQAPTDPDNCHTAVLLDAARAAGCVVDLAQRRPRAEVWRRKARAHAGFDHLRGSFSVNTVENLAIGLAPLVGLRSEYRERLLDEGLGPPGGALEAILPFSSEDGFRRRLRELVADPELTRLSQAAARAWYEDCWRPELIGAKLRRMYEALA